MLIPLTDAENSKMTEFYAYLDGNRTNDVLPEHLRKIVDFTDDNEVVKAASMLYCAKDKEAAQAHLQNVIEHKYPSTDSFLMGGEQTFVSWFVPVVVAAIVIAVVVNTVVVSGDPPVY